MPGGLRHVCGSDDWRFQYSATGKLFHRNRKSVGSFLAPRYELPSPVECTLLHRGFNDSFEVRAADGQRYVLRFSCRRIRGEADVASETEFLTYLNKVGVPVAVPVQARNGALFTYGVLPEGQRPVVLFRYVEGRRPEAGASTDARAQGVTFAHPRGRERLRRWEGLPLPPRFRSSPASSSGQGD